MKKPGMVLLFSILFSGFSWGYGNHVEIDSKLFYRGKKIGSPRVIAEMGERARVIMSDSLRRREYSLEMRPQKISGDDIQINYLLAIKEARNETISRGRILMDSKENGRISIAGGEIEIHLKVRLKKIQFLIDQVFPGDIAEKRPGHTLPNVHHDRK